MAKVHPKTRPEAVAEIQDAIWRDRILRSRELSVEQRLTEVFEMSDVAMGFAHARAMAQLDTDDPDAAWELVRIWDERSRQARERGFYVTERPADPRPQA